MTVVVHGGLQDGELQALGLDPADVLDLSANLHPHGPHPHVLQGARDAELRRYPEADAHTLQAAIAAQSRLAPGQVLVTPGATAAIHLAARALLAPGEPCALWPPTFGEYEAAVIAAGGRIREYRAAPPVFAPVLTVESAALGMLCNPNNPTGTYLGRGDVEALQAQLGAPLVVDVAYDPFVEGAWDVDGLVRDGADIVAVHSMTKLHALPGLRLGYVTGPESLIARLAALQPGWSVGAEALAAGHAMLAVEGVQRGALGDIAATRALMLSTLATRGLELVPGRANFILVRVGAAPMFRLALLRRGFAVRDCSSFGLPEWVRIAVPVEVAARRMLGAFGAAYEETHG